LAVIVAGGQTGGVIVPVGVGENVGVTLPVGVGVKVAVGGVTVPVGVSVKVGVAVAVGVLVAVGVSVGVTESERLRNTTIVWDAAVPSTILTVALPPIRSLLINRLAGIV
jgi:hypothetical protein